jgi:hypothetical protein
VPVHTRIGVVPQSLPTLVDTKQLEGPLPPYFNGSFVQ